MAKEGPRRCLDGVDCVTPSSRSHHRFCPTRRTALESVSSALFEGNGQAGEKTCNTVFALQSKTLFCLNAFVKAGRIDAEISLYARTIITLSSRQMHSLPPSRSNNPGVVVSDETHFIPLSKPTFLRPWRWGKSTFFNMLAA